MVKKWQVQHKELIKDMRLFKIIKHQSYHLDKNMNFDFIILDTNDWVNIIPLTPDNQVIAIKQYRAGVEDIVLEIPGGVVEKSEDPAQAGLRELTEETGYVSTEWETLGYAHPNPAIQNNRCHFILAKNCELKEKTNFDPSEDIETELVPLIEIPNLITTNKLTHSLVQCAFQRLFMKYPELLSPPSTSP